MPFVRWGLLEAVLVALVPVQLAIASATVPTRDPLRHAARSAAIAAATVVAVVLLRPVVGSAPNVVGGVVRVDDVTRVVLAMIALLGVVLARFGRTYLATEPGRDRYARAFLATVAAASTVVVSENVLVLLAAWTGTSFALHRLLTFYGERRSALVAAHKKFLVSRLADVCLAGGFGLLGAAAGSFQLSAIAASASAGALSGRVHVALCLVALGACLKSAQLPFHGWLIQVMEAPTPVSALLHAGVVNLAGVVLLRLGPVLSRASAAQTLLVVVGTTTAVVAALVMTTRVSIKVRLAWSTCAQMGFMVLECGLGLYALALLHLVAHSLYKAHAFLTAGSVVDAARACHGRAARARVTPRDGVLGALLTVPVVAIASHVSAAHGSPTTPILLAVLLGLALAPVLARGVAEGARGALTATVAACAVALAAGALHHAFAAVVGVEEHVSPIRAGIVMAGFGTLLVVRTVLAAAPSGRLARRVHTALFAGFWIDDAFTRLVFRIWTPRLDAAPAPSTLAQRQTLEAR